MSYLGQTMTKDAEFIAFEKALREEIAKEIEAKYCASSDDEDDEPFIPDYENDLGCFGVNEEHCDIIKKCAAIVRGKVSK